MLDQMAVMANTAMDESLSWITPETKIEIKTDITLLTLLFAPRKTPTTLRFTSRSLRFYG